LGGNTILSGGSIPSLGSMPPGRNRCSGSGSFALVAKIAVFGACATAAEAQTTPEPPAKTLAQRIEPLIKAHKGKAAVAVKNLKSGESYSYHAADVMPTASLIKFPVMIEAYRQSAAGRVNLDSTVTPRKGDKVPGSGILTDHFSDGATFALRDAVRLMIKFSDNTATNLVLDAIGMGATAETMEKLGCPDTKIHSKVDRRDTSIAKKPSKPQTTPGAAAVPGTK
jgi:beta-lactamase class A